MTTAASRAKTRDKYRTQAKAAGLSTKAYKAQKFPSVGWGYMVEVIKRRCKKNGAACTITASYLKGLHERQKGVCRVTGWKLEPKKSGSGLCQRTMTVDRIAASKGYVPGNVQLVCFAANNAKYVWSYHELLEFCEAVVGYNQIGGGAC